MIKNHFFFFAGILAIMAAIGHAYVGHQSTLAELEPSIIKHSVFLFLHQTTWFMLASAIILIGGAFFAQPKKISLVAVFIATVFTGNFLFFVISSFVLEQEALANLLPQVTFLVLYVGLIVVGVIKARSGEQHG